ncbi:MAG TPA: GWxTD domain-containing protein [bacterium]
MPNASRIYGTGLNELSFYAEAYNLSFEGSAKESTYHSIYQILDQQGKTVKEYVGQPKKKPGKSCIIYGTLDISDLSSGFYILKIIITDDFTEQIGESSKTFNVYKIEDFIASQKTFSKPEEKLAEDEFNKMNEEELNKYFDQIRYITLKDDNKIFKKLDVNGKRNFIQNFWRLKDPDLETLINEKKIEYSQFLEYANKNFSVGNKPGWKTDLGRILLIYGQPDEIERFPSSPNYRSYQIWRYYILEGGVEFVFVDIRSIRDFELVHSTHSKEIHDDEWQDRYLKF